MANSQSLNYVLVLSDLKSKRSELDKAISALEGLVHRGVLGNIPDGHPPELDRKNEYSSQDMPGPTMYEASVSALREYGKMMTTEQLKMALKSNKVPTNNNYQNLGGILLKTTKRRKDCEIIKVAKGVWDLKQRR
jgi:hypothetical protein